MTKYKKLKTTFVFWFAIFFKLKVYFDCFFFLFTKKLNNPKKPISEQKSTANNTKKTTFSSPFFSNFIKTVSWNWRKKKEERRQYNENSGQKTKKK